MPIRLRSLALLIAGGAVCLGLIAHAQNPAGENGTAKGAPAKAVVQPPSAGAAVPSGQAADAADERAVRDSAEAFVKAYNAHDAKAIAALFAIRAEFIDESDRLIKGREEIEKSFTELFRAHPKGAINVEIASIRMLTPNLAIEEGVVRATRAPSELPNISSYIAVHFKVDGKWLVGSVRDFEAPATAYTAHEHLQALAWLVGDWVDESADATVNTSGRWADNGNFLLQQFSVRMHGRPAMSGTARIGWDAQAKQFRSWVFDSEGGHAEGLWIREGDEWIVKSRGVTPDGQSASSTNVYRFVDRDTFTWRSYDRVIGGQLTADIEEVLIKRRAPAPMQ